MAAWDGTQWVSGAIHETALATSPDGVTWTGRPSDLDEVWGIATDGSRWVAAGYSFDGPGVAWGSEIWIAVGESEGVTPVVATSTDGEIWTPQTVDGSFNGYAVAYARLPPP